MAFTAKEREYLLHIARRSIQSYLEREQFRVQEVPSRLAEQGAAFVTLTKDGRLRGCIGSLVAHQPLYKDVVDNARYAAFRDLRFPSLKSDELSAIRVEVSVLSAARPLRYSGVGQLVSYLQASKPGLILRFGSYQATFLPQVWEELPEPPDFLAHLCLKAGLPPDAWEHERIQYDEYTVEKFGE